VPTIVEFLNKKGIKIDNNPNTKLGPDVYALLVKEYSTEKTVKETSKKIELEYTQHRSISIADKKVSVEDEDLDGQRDELFIRNMPIDNRTIKPQPPKEVVVPEPVKEVKPVVEIKQPEVKEPEVKKPEKEETPVASKEEPVVAPEIKEEPKEEVKPVAETPAPEVKEEPVAEESKGIKVLGKIDLDSFKKPKKSKETHKKEKSVPVEKPIEASEATPAVEEVKPEPVHPKKHKHIAEPVAEAAEPVEAKAPDVPEAPEAPEALKAPEVKEEVKPEVATAPAVPEKESNFLKTEVRRGPVRRDVPKVELSPEDIQKQIKETLQRLSGSGKSKASKHRREKRSIASQHMAEEAAKTSR
jgi:translation initiation factor IF-2